MSVALLGCGRGAGTGTGGPGTPGGAEAVAFLARTSGLDSTHQNAYAALIDGLVADSLWSKFDMLHIYATQDSTTALLNLISTSYNGTSHGSPTFTADRGFTGVDANPSTVWIDTGFDPSTAPSPQYVQNSAHVSVWAASNSGQASSACIGNNGSGSGVDIIPTLTDNNAYYQLNTSGFTSAGANANPQGSYIANRSTSSAIQLYKNGSSISTNNASTSATPTPTSMFTLACSFNGNVHGSNVQMAMASIGSSLNSTEAGNFYTRLRTYMTAVGVP